MTKATARLAILLCVSVFASGQSTSSTSPPKAESVDAPKHDSSNNDDLTQIPVEHGCGGPVDVLSDTQGVNFHPYLQKLCDLVRENWFRLIPESDKSKKGKLAIEFAIKKDGNVEDMRLVASSGDVALDRAAWAGITVSNPLPPLPIEFSGPSIVLRFRFFYHPVKGDVDFPENSAFSHGAPDEKPKNGESVLKGVEDIEIISDTLGVDFEPYLQRILQDVCDSWYRLIPESAYVKKGKLAIQLAITKDGKVADMRLVATSTDVRLDHAAWGSILNLNPFPPLPSGFTGPFLALQFRFYYNPDKTDLGRSYKRAILYLEKNAAETSTPLSPTAEVSISPPGELEVPIGGSRALTATVKGAADKSVTWIITGSGCSGSACGEMKDATYRAPKRLPEPPLVTVMAISNGEPAAKSSVIVHLVPDSPY